MAKKASVFAILVTVFAVGCQSSRTVNSETVLHVALIPSTDPGKIVRESERLVNYLERNGFPGRIGRSHELCGSGRGDCE